MENELNIQIKEWWMLLPDMLRGNMPTFIHTLNKNAQILFVGLNPSGDTTIKQPITDIRDEDIQEKIKSETIAIFGIGKNRESQYKKYYKPITDIADGLKVDFEHCDLFHMSYRTAKVVVKELLNKSQKLKQEHAEHLSVFKEIYEYISPKIVITNNINTANILKVYLDLSFDETTGLYKNTKGTYFYLNGIMSYGRQTKFDKERLIWQIKRYITEEVCE